MNLTPELRQIVDALIPLRPQSVFLYGSRSRNDFLPNSDHEIGAFFPAGEGIDEMTLQEALPRLNDYHVYPYEAASFERGQLLIPFEETIFVRSITASGYTLWGESLIEQMVGPPITLFSLAREVKFQLGRASDALVCYRQGHHGTAHRLFIKSCLWGTRCLYLLHQNRFPVTYREVVARSQELDLQQYAYLPPLALQARQESAPVNPQALLDNVWYLNQLVEQQIMRQYREHGDAIVLL